MMIYLLKKKKKKRMRRPDRINSVLPDELMMEIFRYLESEQDREAFSLVCKRWLNLQRLSRKAICISFTDGTDTVIKLLADRYANVHNVSIDECPWTYIAPKPKHEATRFVDRFCDINGVSPNSGNKENAMRNYCLTDFGLAAVGEGFTKLESLRLISCSYITDAGLISIAEKCKLLKCLDLKLCCVGDRSLAAIGKYCTRLEVLNLSNCDGLTDAGLVQFAFHCGRTLKSLSLRKCRGLTDVSLEAVGSHCKSLGTLSIVLNSVNDKGLLSIAEGCNLLKSLYVQCENVTDEALEAIGHFCLSLESLALLSCFELTDKSLYAIGKGCKKLKTLVIKSCHSLSELGLDYIAHGCAELIRLEVDSCFDIGTTGVKSIGKLACTHLSELVLQNLRFQQLDNDGLHELGNGSKHLQVLHLIGCVGIRRKTLDGILRVFSNLKKLHIRTCDEMGDEEMMCIGENCKDLTDLVLHHRFWVGHREIAAIADACPQLSFLDVRGLQSLCDSEMLAISERCPLLKDLTISACEQITDDGLRYIAENCKLLESCNMMSCSRITKFGVKALVKGCQKLKKIGVEEWKLS